MILPDQPAIAIVGATGAVGTELLAILAQRRFPHRAITLLASARSAGTKLQYRGQTLVVAELTPESFHGLDLAFFGAGGDVSRQFAPHARKAGTIIIDKTSAFRMQPEVPLVIPEVNGSVLDDFDPVHGSGIVAVPNCSTIIALMAASPLHRAVGIKRMVVSTYQSASGAGAAAMRELEQQAHDYAASRPLTQDVFDRPYLFNLFSHDSKVGADGYNDEETKLIRETRKIWSDDSVMITATCVRVPVLRCHSESINMTFRSPLNEAEARRILAEAPGLRIVDDRQANRFPEPVDAHGQDDVLVGRIRADLSQPPGMGLDLFVSGDQLRKGAALNAVQIAERLMQTSKRRNVETSKSRTPVRA
jgi:aspartate-semialdehyde dehydrogenase